MRIGIYVGSFNPPHLGHQKVIEYLLKNSYVDKVEIVATGNYWDKINLIDINHRINMLKFYEKDNVVVNNKLNDLSYTYQVLRCLKEEYLDDELILIIGDDNLPKFHLWKNYQEVLNNKIIVLNRKNINIENTVAYNYNSKNFIIINDFPVCDISSTKVRDYLLNENYKMASMCLNKSVLDYIIEHNLYSNHT